MSVVQWGLATRSGPIGRAASLLESRPDEAEALARDLLKARPDDPEAALVLGAAFRRRGAREAALEIFEPLAAAQPDWWPAQSQLGETLFALGRSRPAVASIERGVQLNPDWTLGWRLLGDIRLFARDFEGAQAADDQFLRASMQAPALRAAAAEMACGRLGAAEQALAALLKSHPQSAAAAHLLAETLARQRRAPEAASLLAACLRGAPEFDLARLAYAEALRQLGQLKPALEQLRVLLARGPRGVRPRILEAMSLAELGDFAPAAEVTASLLHDIPDQPRAWLAQSSTLQFVGRTDGAVAALRRCLELDPDCADAYWGLAVLKTYRFTAEDEARLRALEVRADLSQAAQINVQFSLGRAEEDAGRYEAAFAHYLRGKEIRRAGRPQPASLLRKQIDGLKAVLTPQFFAEREDGGWAAPDPIFIVGMPRSGSTLVEQILASHADVEGTQELQELAVMARFLSDGDLEARYSPALAGLTRQQRAQLGRDYIEATRPYRRQARPLFTDKAPINFLHTGLIHLILPNAKIIDIRRHPLGCCLSIFKENFESVSDFESLGLAYTGYVELMAHYDAVLPGRVHRVIYEDLVTNTEGEVRRLLDHLGLPFDPACLRFFENPRSVATISAGQVRQPIYSHAVDRWRRFEPWLGPLKTALGPVLEAYLQAPAG
jgi:predicted Zn-dependent protease